MNNTQASIEKLEQVNDIIARGIDDAGAASEIFLAKLSYFLAVHHCSADTLHKAVKSSLEDLPAHRSFDSDDR